MILRRYWEFRLRLIGGRRGVVVVTVVVALVVVVAVAVCAYVPGFSFI